MSEAEKIGVYQILRPIGKGGMGEVLLVYDPVSERNVALKRIRDDLKLHSAIRQRFLREAKIAAQLTHPGIISIYNIYPEDLYYTMPYVEGETLKQILKSGHPTRSSISVLLPIFRSLCQTVAYIHSKGIIHRDLKPENILVGKFGEVILLDWGLATPLSQQREELDLDIPAANPEITHPGKVVGTLAYMAPERAMGFPASGQTDIYALGVILYQILTLHLPFERANIKEFKKNALQEKLPDPEEIAPYRDVPPRLSTIVKKCLEPNPKERYQTMDALIHDLATIMEGRSEWFEVAKLNTRRKEDWEFQENVFTAKHIAITRGTEAAEWVSIMLSKTSFAENTRIETHVAIGENGAGVGFLLSVSEVSQRKEPIEGYCIWLGTEETPFTQVFRNTIEVMHVPEVYLKRKQWHKIVIEKMDNHLHLFLDGVHRFSYISYLPLVGTHVGILSRDADYHMKELAVFMRGQNLQISCLAIGDAFLATKDYVHALAEYRRIGYSFPGHAEGREALFRAGVTLLEQAKAANNDPAQAQEFYALALEEFAKLHKTPGAPMEYLGKSLVYHAMGEEQEEIKCLELALRRYHKHPLISAIKEQIIYRMHESSQLRRRSAYQLILIVLRHLPESVQTSNTQRLFKYLAAHWESLPFFENPLDPSRIEAEKDHRQRTLNEFHFALILAFWLANPFVLLEIFHEICSVKPTDPPLLGNLLYALYEFGALDTAKKLKEILREMEGKRTKEEREELGDILALLEPIEICHEHSLKKAIEAFFSLNRIDIGLREVRTASYLMQYALRSRQLEMVEEIAQKLLPFPLSREDRIQIDAYRIWAYLLRNDWHAAGSIFETYPLELLNQETTLLHPLYGCWLYVTEGEELANIHFSGVIDTPYPRTWALLSHELIGNLSEPPSWYEDSFLWERLQLYRQLALYHHCRGNLSKEIYYQELEKKEMESIHVPD